MITISVQSIVIHNVNGTGLTENALTTTQHILELATGGVL